MTPQLTEQFVAVLLVEFIILVSPLFFIAFDLWAGIRKAKQRGEAITSSGWKRTVNKIAKYYNMLLALGVLDILQLGSFWYLNNYSNWDLPMFPWLTMIGALFVGAIEVKSIIEPADAKEAKEMNQVAELAKAIAAHKSDPKEIASAIAMYLNSSETEN